MVIRVEAMCISPVKSLGLAPVARARLDKAGIAGDRAFFIVDERARLFTQREHGALVQVGAAYDTQSGELVRGVVEVGEPVSTSFFGKREVEGYVVRGEWGEALSEFAGRRLRLVKAARAGGAFDGYPISMCSAGSLEALARAAGRESVDGRRFRQNIYLSTAEAHVEDTWIGREVRVGSAVLRVKMADPRCAITTHDPDTGSIDMHTLKLIASYRTDQPKDVNFGVYCTVTQPGEVAIGDEVRPIQVSGALGLG